jgi:hypothetical protein
LLSPAPAAALLLPAPAPPRAETLTFPITAGLVGSVSVVPSASSYQITVRAAGMTPGSTHGVHLHFGACPSSGVHILALGSLDAGADGKAVLTTRVGMPYQGDGRFVIIYAGAGPGALAGCAQLSGQA